MRFTSTTCLSLGLLPFAVVLAAPSPSFQPVSSVIDSYISQASSIALPCPNCLGPQAVDFSAPLDLSLDFGVTPGSNPCASNLTLNSVPLESSTLWDFEPKFLQGHTTVNASGNELVVSWFTACNTTSDEEDGAQLLTVNVNTVNGKAVDRSSLAGFTLTFKDIHPARLLRYTHHPISPSELDPILYIPSVEVDSEDSEEDSDDLLPLRIDEDQELQDHLNDLRRLKAQLTELEKAIKTKQNTVHEKLYSLLKQQFKECEGPFCKVKAVFKHFHDQVHVFFLKVGAHSNDAIFQASSWLRHGQKPTMVSSNTSYPDEKKTDPFALPKKPEDCHCRDRPDSVSTAPPPYDELPSVPDDGRVRDAEPQSTFHIILKFLLAISGFALILALFRRCFASPRRRQNRAARREQRKREKEYWCASRRQLFWDWMRGRRRGTPGRRVGDLDEKARLVAPQEAILRQHMEDEIQQLKIHEEIAQFRSTRDVVDELIRAEEGRIVPPSYAPPSMPGPSYYHGTPYPSGVVSIPRPIMIPPRPGTNESEVSSPTSSIGPFSPMSRTTSLPSYRSKPPSYREELSSNDGFSDCDLSADSMSEAEGDEWRSDSSIPDFSPRPSAETARTFL